MDNVQELERIQQRVAEIRKNVDEFAKFTIHTIPDLTEGGENVDTVTYIKALGNLIAAVSITKCLENATEALNDAVNASADFEGVLSGVCKTSDSSSDNLNAEIRSLIDTINSQKIIID